MGRTHEQSHGSIRFSLSKFNTEDEIDYTVEKLKSIIKDLRELSPLGKE
jgi:cysteine desulfurase